MTSAEFNLHLTFNDESTALFVALSAALSESSPNELDLRKYSRPHVTLCRTKETLDLSGGLPCRVRLTCGTPYLSPRNGRHILVPVHPNNSDSAMVREALRRASKTPVSIADIEEWHVSIGYLTVDPASALSRLPCLTGREVLTAQLQLAVATRHGGLGRVVTTAER
jgi:hypothetical protein